MQNDMNTNQINTGDEVVTNHNTEYRVARQVSSVISFIGWALVIAGVVTTIIAVANGMGSRYSSLSLMVILPCLGTVVSGFLLIMGAQVTRATVDNADHTREILKALKIK